MAIRRIRLTESELTRLIKRIVEDTEEEINLGMLDDKSDDNKMSKAEENRAIRKIASFLEQDVLPNLSHSEKRELMRKVEMVKSPIGLHEDEDEEEEDIDDLDSRRASRKEKMLMRGGLATSAVGAVLALGEFMGYSEFELTSMLHDFNSLAELGKYTGPVTVAMVWAGLALALKGLDMRVRRTGK